MYHEHPEWQIQNCKRRREPSDYRAFYPSTASGKRRRRNSIADYTNCSTQQQSIFQQNAVYSQLLRLPAEIRNEIYGHVLSNQVIHISVRECPRHDASSFSHADYYRRQISGCRSCEDIRNSFLKVTHSVCALPCDEEDHARTLAKIRNAQTSTPPTEKDMTIYRLRHNPCYRALARLKGNWIRDGTDVTASPWFKPATSPGLAVHFLQTCRQIYTETRDLIYATNTFAFHEGNTLELFLSKCLTPPQRHLITRLQLDGWMSDSFEPGQGIKTATLQRLTGLKSVSIAVTNAYFNIDMLRREQYPHFAVGPGGPVLVAKRSDLQARSDVVKVTVDRKPNGWCDALELEGLVKRNAEVAFGLRNLSRAEDGGLGLLQEETLEVTALVR